jgi:hypothetical protein
MPGRKAKRVEVIDPLEIEHKVTIQHLFKTKNGSWIRVSVSQESDTIDINYWIDGDTSSVSLDQEDLPILAKLFTKAANYFYPEEETYATQTRDRPVDSEPESGSEDAAAIQELRPIRRDKATGVD